MTNKDYAKRRSLKKKRSQPSKGNVSFWVLLGVILGLVIAGFLYFKVQKERSFEQVTPIKKSKVHKKTAKSSAPIVEKIPQPKFDFYNVLADDDSATKSPPKPPQQQLANTPPAAPPDVPPEQTVTPTRQPEKTVASADEEATADKSDKPSSEAIAAETKKQLEKELTQASSSGARGANSPEQFMLEVAVLDRRQAARELRDYLLLQGLAPHMTPVKSRSHDVRYRVWLGPFASSTLAKKQKQQLNSSLINADSLVVKKIAS